MFICFVLSLYCAYFSIVKNPLIRGLQSSPLIRPRRGAIAFLALPLIQKNGCKFKLISTLTFKAENLPFLIFTNQCLYPNLESPNATGPKTAYHTLFGMRGHLVTHKTRPTSPSFLCHICTLLTTTVCMIQIMVLCKGSVVFHQTNVTK